MIVGKIEYRPEKESSYFHLTFFIETDEKIKECPQVEDRISEFYLSQQNVVTLLGEKNGRVVLMVVAQLENVDLYRALIDYHLSRTADFELKCYDICEKLKELESCLTRVILFENNRVATIDSIPDEDPLLSILSFGGYEFNDFILAETEFLLPAESKSLSSADLAAVEAAQLLRMIKTYPPPNGLLFNIIKFQDEMHYFTMNYRSERQKVAILKPKYPVNAFNMFAKNEHEALKKEFSQFPISNNELNQIMGQRWKGMSGEQKLPFLQLAAADKIRYKEEMKNAQGKKPLSDYNYFVQQEKQFISATTSKNSSSVIGKHAGDRWGIIHPEEKRLYEIMRSVDEEAYERQFIR